MKLKICTWNSQGNPFNDKDKHRIFDSLYASNDVLLLQECGTIAQNLGHNYMYLTGEQAGARNRRCSLCIISKYQFSDISPKSITSNSGRPALGIKIGGISIYTLHALSGNGMSDVMNIFRTATPPFIIGGDMNCDRNELLYRHGLLYSQTNFLFSGTRSRPYPEGELISSERRTHPDSNAELDYFIISLDLRSSCTNIDSRIGGDHYPVCTQIMECGKNWSKRRVNALRSFFNFI